MAFYLGFDYWEYLGDQWMQDWWYYSPYYYTGFYLAPAPQHSDTSYMDKRATLENQGWGFLVIYLGHQYEDSPSIEQGRLDAQDAHNLAKKAGFPYATTIFFDVEVPTTDQDYLNYLEAWADEIMANTDYYPGFYISYAYADNLKNMGGNMDSAEYWVYNVNCPPSPGCDDSDTELDPAGSKVSYATAWQYAQSPEPAGSGCTNYVDGQCPQSYGGHEANIDINTADSTNPSEG